MKVVKIGGISDSNLGDDPGPRTTGDGGKGTRGPVDVEGGGAEGLRRKRQGVGVGLDSVVIKARAWGIVEWCVVSRGSLGNCTLTERHGWREKKGEGTFGEQRFDRRS